MKSKNYYKLATLMERFGTTSKELADAIHVDHSLVSKWKNGTRILKPNSMHLDNICRFYVALDNDMNLNILHDLIEVKNMDFDQASPDLKIKALKRWLLIRPTLTGDESLIEAFQQGDCVAVQFHVFRGASGRKEASEQFRKLALHLPPGQELFIHSQSRQTWQDREVYIQWQQDYTQILENGNRIVVVHSLDRDIKSIHDLLASWLPMEKTGNLDSYYLVKHMSSEIKPTILINKDHVAFVNLYIEGVTDYNSTLFFSDPITVENLYLYFRFFMQNSQPIFKRYQPHQRALFLEHIQKSQMHTGNIYSFSVFPPMHLYPMDVLADILTDNHLESSLANLTLDYARSYHENMEEFQLRHHTRLVLRLPELAKAMQAESIIHHESAAITGTALVVTKKDLCKQLQFIKKMMMQYESFEVALVVDLDFLEQSDIQWYTKENDLTLAHFTTDDNEIPNVLVCKEATINNALYLYFQDLWNSIPTIQRDKKWVCEQLDFLCDI